MAEKFKPLEPRDLSGKQKEAIELTEYYWVKHPVVDNYHGLWEEYIAWYEGDQYTFWSKITQRLESAEAMVDRKVKNVYNRTQPLCRQVWGEMRYPHVFHVEPQTSEPEDIKAAKVNSALIEYTNGLRHFGRKINFAKLWAIICGNVFWKEWWDKNLYGFVESEKKGKPPVKEPGDCNYNTVSPFNIRPDPEAAGREDWRFLIEGKLLPKAAVEDEFGIERGKLPPDNILKTTVGLFVRPEYKKGRDEMIIRKETWMAPDSEHKKGRFVVSAGGWLLYDGESPSPSGQIPYFHLQGLGPILGEQWGDSLVRIVQQPQKQFNKLGSIVDEHIENYKLKAMIPRGSLTEGEITEFVRSGVSYVLFNPTGYGNPYWQQPPALPEFVYRHLLFQENEMEIESAVRKTMQGQLPKYATRASGELFKGLVAQDQKVLFPAIEDQEVELQAAMKLRLEIMQEHYTIPRMVKITGKNKETSVIYVKGADIRGNTDVVIESGVDIIQSRQAKREVVEAMIQKGLISNPREALELLDVKGIEQYMEEQYVDERQAYRVIELFKQGRPYIEPVEDDNHEVGYKIFNNFRKTEEFETVDKEVQDKILKRLAAHKAFRDKAAQPTPEEAAAPTEQPAAEVAAAEGLPPGVPPEAANIPPEILAQAIAEVTGGQGVPQ